MPGFRHQMEKQMTKATFVFAALIAAAAFTTQAMATSAMAARNEVAARHAAIRAHRAVVDCVRAPDVGAFASDPYPVPPCMPYSASGTFR